MEFPCDDDSSTSALLLGAPEAPCTQDRPGEPSNPTEPMIRALRLAACGVALLLASAAAGSAARPIVDLHTLDAYFALYAPDSNVPWKPANVRLDTYSSAEVDFAAYAVDPTDVVTAGSGARPRAIDTRKLKPVATWRFTPPGGYQYQTSTIAVPLAAREGFFVVEARRGAVAEQVWINRTRVGLVVKQSPACLAIYGADLGTGKALAGMRMQLLSGARFVTRNTDAHGIVRWTAANGPRPVFVIAQWGGSYAFVSPLPQAPLPTTIVGVRTDSAVVHAGESVRVAGFARTRRGSALRASTGSVQIALRDGPTLVAQSSEPLDAAGAFSATFAVPASARAGEYAILASVDGGVGGTTVHVDGNAGGLALSVQPQCAGTCTADAAVPLIVRATRNGSAAGGVAVRVQVVRSPHVGGDENAAWGLATWLDATVTTGGDGRATIAIPRPTDGLASTYGVSLQAGGATAQTRILVPTARVALRILPDRNAVAFGAPASFTVTAADASSGRPAGDLAVRVTLERGGASQQQTISLDASGVGRGAFAAPPLGTNLIVASTTVDRATASDAAQIEVAAPGGDVASDDSSADVRIAPDRDEYRVNDTARILASDAGAVGDALISLENGAEPVLTVTPAGANGAQAQFRIEDAPGAVSAGAAFVRDGTIEWNVLPLGIDAPGRAVASALRAPEALHAGTSANMSLSGGGNGTLVVRVSRGAPSGGAAFEGAPALVDVDVASTQSSAPADATWHPWVDASGDRAQVVGFARRSAPPATDVLVGADSHAVYWKVERISGEAFALPLPLEGGAYVVSVLRVDDDGRVTAASSNIEVR